MTSVSKSATTNTAESLTVFEGSQTRLTFSHKFLSVLLLLNTFLSAASVPLYMLVPVGAVKNFGGDSSPTALFWCQLVGGGDALMAYLMGWAFFTRSAEVRRNCLRGLGVYCVFHFVGFLRGAYSYGQHISTAMIVQFWCSLLFSVGVSLWFGWIRPTTGFDARQILPTFIARASCCASKHNS